MNIIIAWIFALASISCKKETAGDNINPESLVPLSVEFDNIFGGQNMRLNSAVFTTSSGEDLSVTMLQYFISNIKLKNSNGTEYIVPQDSSYFLVKESDAETRFARLNVPEGDYSQLTFTLGVDSLRSTMDITKRTGVLDPAGGMEDGMYWGWNSGYIFFKFEGISESAPVDPSGQKKFRYHIGGFGGYSAPTINNIRTITIDLNAGGIARARQGRKANIHLLVDISKVFDGTAKVKISNGASVMFSQASVAIANNFMDMFRHDHTEN